MKKQKLALGFFFSAIAIVLLFVGYLLMIKTYEVFRYNENRWMIFCIVTAAFCLIFATVNSLLRGDKPFGLNGILYAAAIFCMVLALCYFIKPCLSPIGIYFTVHNMGDVETNAVGVPLSLAAASVTFLAVLLTLAASFMASKKEIKFGQKKSFKPTAGKPRSVKEKGGVK